MKKNSRVIVVAGVIIIGLVAVLSYINKNSSSKNDVVRIGTILPLTGPVSDDGQEALVGVKIARERIKNESDGNIDVIIEDGKYSPKESISAVRKLLSNSNIGAIVAYGVVPVEAMMPVVKVDKIPLLATAVGAQDFPSLADAFMRVWFPIGRIARLMSEFARNVFDKPKIAILCIDNSYGSEASAAFSSDYMKHGGIITANDSFSMDDVDIKSQVTKILNSSPDLIFISGFGQGYISAINQLRELGFSGPLLTDTAIVDPKVCKSVKNLSNIYFVDSCYSDICESNSEAIAFKRAYASHTKQQVPSMQALFSYEAIMLGHDVLKDGYKSVVSRRYNSLLGEIYFDENGEIVLPLYIRCFTDEGEPKLIDDHLWTYIR